MSYCPCCSQTGWLWALFCGLFVCLRIWEWDINLLFITFMLYIALVCVTLTALHTAQNTNIKLCHVPFFCLFPYSALFFFLDRETCDLSISLCRGACCDSHVSGDGEDHHQADVRLPEELHLWRWLWMCSGGIRLGSPRPQSGAGTRTSSAASFCKSQIFIRHTDTHSLPSLCYLMLIFVQQNQVTEN